jgi:hypothetical protein
MGKLTLEVKNERRKIVDPYRCMSEKPERSRVIKWEGRIARNSD